MSNTHNHDQLLKYDVNLHSTWLQTNISKIHHQIGKSSLSVLDDYDNQL